LIENSSTNIEYILYPFESDNDLIITICAENLTDMDGAIEIQPAEFETYGYVYVLQNGYKLYINGSLLTTYTSYTALETNTNALYIGKFSYGGVLSGKVYNSKIYNRVLTPDEVKQNFNATRGRYGI
jgi:hypothetical protein